MKILITGGAGFIGSTIASACSDAGHEPVIIDDLSQGIRAFAARFPFYEGDYGDDRLLERVFSDHPTISAAVHCAAHTVVSDSVADPIRYYQNNISGLPAFVATLLKFGCTRLLFSSSAAIYMNPRSTLVVTEQSPLDPQSPYAATKMMAERLLADAAAATALRVISLRYFNPIGSDPELRTGLQHPQPSHVLGKIMSAAETGSPFTVTGTDWPTRDGSGLRDYIHVWDLAQAHVAALDALDAVVSDTQPSVPINIGTGSGTTVFELIRAFESVTGVQLNVVNGPRRPGDVAGACASAELALTTLGWRPAFSLNRGIHDALQWREKFLRTMFDS
ncbi:MAG TPA: UDP-glucose 4-epimerase GalE [Propionibacteriaceae bacterium]|nr:UDP-glucose 4-epimerase GalE [Propionibacteriaceae bacterium]